MPLCFTVPESVLGPRAPVVGIDVPAAAAPNADVAEGGQPVSEL